MGTSFKDYWIAGFILLISFTAISFLVSMTLASLLTGEVMPLDERGRMLTQYAVTGAHFVITPYVIAKIAKYVNERFLSGV